MAGVLDSVQRASFGDVEFACERVAIRGALRDFVHEYKHTAGGQPEIQGRRLYTFEFDALFSAEHPLYPDAWPGSWDKLQSKFEAGTIADLVVPTLGTLKAYCLDWPVDVDFKRMRDGIKARLTFREDNDAIFNALVDPDSIPSLPTRVAALKEEVANAAEFSTGSAIEDPGNAPISIGLFDAIIGLAADIEAAAQFSEFVVEQYIDKVTALVESCQRLEERTAALNKPKNWKIVRAIQALGVSAIKIGEDVQRRLSPVILFEVPAVMSIVDVSVSLYGDATHAVELLNLNRDPIIEDAFAIPQGYVLRAYAPSST